MPSERNIFQPNPKLAAEAYVTSLEQYHDIYKQSLDNPESFWSDIAKQFHWETPYEKNKFFSYNFDITKGPIEIKWMEGASTNISYNLLDRNVRNGLGDTVAYYWWVESFSYFCFGEKSILFHVIITNIFIRPPTLFCFIYSPDCFIKVGKTGVQESELSFLYKIDMKSFSSRSLALFNRRLRTTLAYINISGLLDSYAKMDFHKYFKLKNTQYYLFIALTPCHLEPH